MNRLTFIFILLSGPSLLVQPCLAQGKTDAASAMGVDAVEITAPLAGDIMWPGQWMVVTWKGGTGDGDVTLRLLRSSKPTGPKKNCPNNGSCQFRIPSIALSGEYQVHLSGPGGEVTSKPFLLKSAPASAVQASAVQLLPDRELNSSPTDQKIDRGQRLSLRWPAGGPDEKVSIRLMKDTLTVKVKSDVPNVGKKGFQIPRMAPLGNLYFRLDGPQGVLVSRPFVVKRPSWWLSSLFNFF